MIQERILVEIQGNVCTRRFYDFLDDAATLPLGIALAQPWHVEGQDVAASQAAYDAAQNAAAAETTRLAAIDAAIMSAVVAGTTLTQLKAMTVAQFNAWWAANVTTLPAVITAAKWIAWLVIRKVL